MNDSGEQVQVSAHKLIATTFLEYPTDGLVYIPNHIDEDPTNNEMENIEYLTLIDNVRYSAHKSRKQIPVHVRDVASGEIFEYPTISSAGRVFGIHTHTVRHRCELSPDRVFNGMQFKYGSDDWKDVSNMAGTNKKTYLKSYTDNKILIFSNQRDCAEYLNMSESALSQYISSGCTRLLPGYHVASRNAVGMQWPLFDNLKLAYVKDGIQRIPGKTRGVRVTDRNGEEHLFTTAASAAAAFGIGATTLTWRLKQPKGTVSRDGNIYEYC